MRSSTGRGLWIVLGIGGLACASAGTLTSGCGGGDSGTAVDEDTGTPTPDGGDLDGDEVPVCGNGTKEGVEECDDGNKIDGDGCQSDCTLQCKPGDPLRGDTKCDDHNPCNGVEACTAAKTCSTGTPLKDGDSCGTAKTCKGGICLDDSCGDGITTAPEECDDGNVTNGDGCDSCKFSCVATDTARNCTSTNPCMANGTCDAAKHTCTAGATSPDGTACGTGKTCKAGVCTPLTCGNGTIDTGEDCDPPAAGTCDATCHKIAAVACGNGTRETGEQCDDGNVLNLDGCNSTCKFEQDQRANSVKMQMGSGSTDTYCTINALGGAIGGLAQAQVQKPIDDGVAAGTMNIMFQFLDLDDLTGTADSAITLGGLNGTVVTGTGYSGTSDLDWWYTAAATSIDASRKPTATLTGSIAARALTAGPGNMVLNVVLSGASVPLSLSSTKLKATTTAQNAPKVSTGATPGHLASEHLNPTVQSFPTMTNGELCGNVSAYSLSKIPAPAAVISGGTTACSQGYTATNSLLDVLVGGCTVLFTVITKVQPDQSDPTAPVAGAGPKYTLVAGTGKAVTSCKDKSGATVDLDTCLKSAAYSAFFKFTTDRVIIK